MTDNEVIPNKVLKSVIVIVNKKFDIVVDLENSKLFDKRCVFDVTTKTNFQKNLYRKAVLTFNMYCGEDTCVTDLTYHFELKTGGSNSYDLNSCLYFDKKNNWDGYDTERFCDVAIGDKFRLGGHLYFKTGDNETSGYSAKRVNGGKGVYVLKNDNVFVKDRSLQAKVKNEVSK